MRLQMCSFGVGRYMCPTLLVFYQYNHMKALSHPFQVPPPFPPSAHHPISISTSVLLLSCTFPFQCKGPEYALWAAINKERCGESY